MKDVVIVGSGYGGSILAGRLAAAGLSVLLLERGPRLSLGDLRQSDDLKYLQSTIDLVVSSSNVSFRTGNMLGGASIPMDGAHFRVPSVVFEAKDPSGRRIWPASYDRQAMTPYYERAEAMLKVRQFAWNEVSKAGGLFAQLLARAGASSERARLNYADCLQCGYCAQGCIYDKKVNMLQTYLPLAEASGAEVRTSTRALTVEPITGGYRVNAETNGEATTAEGKRVVVACGGLHSPALLLRSAKALPRLSEHVGRHFNMNGEHAFIGVLPEGYAGADDYYCYMGSDNACVMSFHWLESDGFTLHPGGGIEPSIFSASLSATSHPFLPKKAWGLEYKRFVETVYPHRVIAFSALGLDAGFQRVVINRKGEPDVESEDRTASDAYMDRVEKVVADVGSQSGVAIVPAVPRKLAGTTAAHLLSACRMAERIEDGVVAPDGQVFGYENLYVVDASVMPSAIAVNPSLTISALAERIAEGILAKG